MAMQKGPKRDRLRDAGLIADKPLSSEHDEVIDEMSDDEVEALLTLKQRLDDRGITTEPLTEDAVSIVVL